MHNSSQEKKKIELQKTRTNHIEKRKVQSINYIKTKFSNLQEILYVQLKKNKERTKKCVILLYKKNENKVY